MYIIISVLLLIINIIQFIYLKLQQNKQYKNYINSKQQQLKEELIKRKDELEKDYIIKEQELVGKYDSLNNSLYNKYDKESQSINSQLTQQRNQLDLLKQELTLREEQINQGKTHIDEQLKQYKEQATYKIDVELKQYSTSKRTAIDKDMADFNAAAAEQKEATAAEIQKLQEELSEYQKKLTAINEAILREREIKEKETFYRLNLTENEISDILYIKEFENKFSNKELLQKAVYECYYKKPLAELQKRVLQNEEFSGIYKITSLKNEEAYIGRAVNIKKRWTDHIKSSMGIGTLVSSNFHKRLAEDGCWNFTFEVLEKVEKDNLSEREAYWIDFYQTNIYGLNSKRGG